jgi:hypothetical protein
LNALITSTGETDWMTGRGFKSRQNTTQAENYKKKEKEKIKNDKTKLVGWFSRL